ESGPRQWQAVAGKHRGGRARRDVENGKEGLAGSQRFVEAEHCEHARVVEAHLSDDDQGRAVGERVIVAGGQGDVAGDAEPDAVVVRTVDALAGERSDEADLTEIVDS